MHAHCHSRREKNIKTAALLNISFTIIEIVGGLWTNSFAILADALHDFGDSIALITALIAEKKARKPADAKRTYGYQRLSLFSSLFAAAVLVFGSLLMLSEAIPRLINPSQTHAPGMIGLAILGVVVNGIGMWRLKQGHSQNEKVLSWHLLEDMLGWVVILMGGVIMLFWDNHIIDPILSIGFTVFVLWGVIRNLKGTFNILMQGVPENIDTQALKQSLLAVDGVQGVHDMHVWSMEGETNIFTGHVIVSSPILQNPENTRRAIKQVLAKHHIELSTIELESADFCSGDD